MINISEVVETNKMIEREIRIQILFKNAMPVIDIGLKGVGAMKVIFQNRFERNPQSEQDKHGADSGSVFACQAMEQDRYGSVEQSLKQREVCACSKWHCFI